jgi:hypothetical protein
MPLDHDPLGPLTLTGVSSEDVAYMYYRSLKTLKTPADLIKFPGSLTDEMPENAESPSGNEWCQEPI